MTRAVFDNVINLPFNLIAEGLAQETYRDILGSPYLRNFLALRNAGRTINHLAGLASNQVAFFNPHNPNQHNPEVDAVLRAGFENLILSIGGHVEATEITGDKATLSLLRAKGQRLGLAIEGSEAFTKIQEVIGLPDIGTAFAAKRLTSRQLLDLRYSKHGQILRDWFADGERENADETVRRYVESVGQPSWIENVPSKLLRFATTTATGVLSPVAGAMASAVDTFLLSKWFPGRSPRLFMKQAKVMLMNTPVIPKPTMKGRDRNSPCSCGSGKKLKHCCGK